MNYRAEKDHDRQLIELAKALNDAQSLELLAVAFYIDGELGPLERARRRRPFDVELTFSNLSVVIESKVDSDENGRWPKQSEEQEWQTTAIARKTKELSYLKPKKAHRFITYGTAEFYIKADQWKRQTQYLPGPYSSEFKHIGLDRIISLVRSAEGVLPSSSRRREWLGLMRTEQEKRAQAPKLLQSFAAFRMQYLAIHGGENDFPRSRLLFCAPELAFPVFHLIAQKWNRSEHAKQFGRVTIYPVGRLSPPVQDSILNFWEMWRGDTPCYLGRTLEESERLHLYFEINEDFNLNLKSEVDLPPGDRQHIWTRLGDANWPDFATACRRNYRQSAYVLYEIDFGLLQNLNNIGRVADNLAKTLQVSIQALSQ